MAKTAANNSLINLSAFPMFFFIFFFLMLKKAMNRSFSIVETVHYKYNANKGMIVGISPDEGYTLVCFWSVFWWAYHEMDWLFRQQQEPYCCCFCQQSSA
jgi:hypothetical protein